MPSPLQGRIVCALAVTFVLTNCGQSQPPGGPPPPTVTVAKPIQRSVTDSDEYVGRFVAVDSVEIRARVSGYLDKIHFQDGQLVKQGDRLFTIDPRPFQNTLEQAKSNLAQARATLSFAEADLGRGQQLVRDKTITEQTFDQRTQSFKSAQASVANNEAAVRQAELDLEFTELKAPVSGRIGDRRVSPGNLVAGSAAGTTTLLATIVSLDPIRFEFTFDEASYLRYERNFKAGVDEASRSRRLPVKLKLIDEQTFQHQGRIDFIDNVIERSTGTVRGRAEFSNLDGLFTPGMFGRLQVPGSQPYQALLVPEAAIGTDQARKNVFVVGDDNIVRQKYLVLGDLTEDNMRVVKDGLDGNDRVIVNGMVRARSGIKVNPVEAGAAPQGPPGAPGAPPKAN